jgi:E3 ubiquitin-protein ligase UBR1
MLGLIIYMKRCLSAKIPPQSRTSPPIEECRGEALGIFGNFKGIMVSILRSAGPFGDVDGALALVDEETLSKLLYTQTLPYLRRTAIIYYAVAGAYPVTNPDFITTTGCEYNRLLSLLGIPNPRETLSRHQASETSMMTRWLSQWALQGRQVPHLEYPGIYELCRLPKAWDIMVLKFIEKRCERCHNIPNFPAMCLYCGKFVCLAGDCCAEGEQGECNLHMRE